MGYTASPSTKLYKSSYSNHSSLNTRHYSVNLRQSKYSHLLCIWTRGFLNIFLEMQKSLRPQRILKNEHKWANHTCWIYSEYCFYDVRGQVVLNTITTICLGLNFRQECSRDPSTLSWTLTKLDFWRVVLWIFKLWYMFMSFEDHFGLVHGNGGAPIN